MAGIGRVSNAAWLAIAAGVLGVQALVLLALGQPLICACGTIKFWHGVVTSSENSQHLTDWYTFSHIIHGVLFYVVLTLLFPKSPLGLRFVIAVGIEVAWEIVENTPQVINRYRRSALAQGYNGDSIVNSLTDTLAMVVGFVLARILPIPATIAVVLVLELGTLYAIRDNLTLNVVQLIRPSAALSEWQSRR